MQTDHSGKKWTEEGNSSDLKEATGLEKIGKCLMCRVMRRCRNFLTYAQRTIYDSRREWMTVFGPGQFQGFPLLHVFFLLLINAHIGQRQLKWAAVIPFLGSPYSTKLGPWDYVKLGGPHSFLLRINTHSGTRWGDESAKDQTTGGNCLLLCEATKVKYGFMIHKITEVLVLVDCCSLFFHRLLMGKKRFY